MALLGFEGFDNIESNPTATSPFNNMPFGTTAVVNGRWSVSGTTGVAKGAGLLGGFAIVSNGPTFSGSVTCTLISNYTTFILGGRFRTTNTLGAVDLFSFSDGATVQCGVSVNAIGHLIFWRGTNATVLATGSTFLVGSSWYMIDITVTINNSVGSVQINLGGVSEISASNLDTQNSANAWLNKFSFGITVSGNAIDDIYACDTTGPAPYNAPLGVIRVETLFPTANNSVTWTPLASTNVSQVQEVNMDSDTSYNFNTTTGVDTFTHGALSSTPTTIFAVDVISAARKTDVTALNFRTKLISGATTQNGSTSALATAYIYVRDSYETDPNTGSAWGGAAVNASDIGYERF